MVTFAPNGHIRVKNHDLSDYSITFPSGRVMPTLHLVRATIPGPCTQLAAALSGAGWESNRPHR